MRDMRVRQWLEDQLKFLNKSIFTKIRVNSSVLFPCKQVWKIFALPVAFCQSWPLTTLNPQFCLAAQYLFFCTGQMRNQWWPLVHCPFVSHIWSIFLNLFQSFKSHCLLLGALWISGDLAIFKKMGQNIWKNDSTCNRWLCGKREGGILDAKESSWAIARIRSTIQWNG